MKAKISKTKKVKKPLKKEHKQVSIAKLKHVQVIKTMVENGGKTKNKKGVDESKISLYHTMIAQGYSEPYARSGKIKGTRAWAEIMDDVFDDDKLADLHNKQLQAKEVKVISFPRMTEEDIIMDICSQSGFIVTHVRDYMGQRHAFCIVPALKIREGALDQAYKIKGRYKETIRVEQDKFRKMSDEEIGQIIKQGKKFFTKQ